MKSRTPYLLLGLAIAGFVVFYPTKKAPTPAPRAVPVSEDPADHRAEAPKAHETPELYGRPMPPAVRGAISSAQTGGVIRYEMPDGVVGFTDDEKRVPAKATRVARGYRGSDGRWTYTGPGSWRPSNAFRPEPPSAEEGAWRAAQRMAEERLSNARAVREAFPSDTGVGAYADARVRDAERNMERLEDECRRSAGCLPGFLR